MNNKILKMGIISCIVMSSLGVAMPITCAAEPAEKLSTSEVVVTANRTQEEIKAIPQATEVITAQDIQDLGATTVQDALALAHDVTVRSGTVGSNVQIRGMSKNHIKYENEKNINIPNKWEEAERLLLLMELTPICMVCIAPIIQLLSMILKMPIKTHCVLT